MISVAKNAIKGSALEPIAQKYRVALARKTTIEFPVSDKRLSVELPSGDWHTEHLAKLSDAGELYEPALTAELTDEFDSDTVFYDVGAGIGFFPMLAVTVGVPGDSVHAFDPNTYRCFVIQHNTASKGVTAVNKAVGAQPADGRITIDGYADRHRPPDIVKVDVEGGELEVIEGMLQTLRSHAPTLYIEVHPQFLPDGKRSVKEIYTTLQSCDYECRAIDHRTDGRGWINSVGSMAEFDDEFLLKASR